MDTNDQGAPDAPGTTRADAVLERLGAAIGATVDISLVYGAPIERGGVTVVPVAKARWGFGGRTDRDAPGARADARGGGGLVLSPVGYIEVRDGGARFRPIRDPAALLLVALCGGVIARLLGRILGTAFPSGTERGR